MGLNDRPSGERVHISFFGLRNAGKSSVVNAVTGQALSLVSQVKGTTTDPVQKAMELLPIGPVVIIDTPGIDDVGGLGQLRVQRALQVLDKTDVAILVVDGTLGMQPDDRQLTEQFQTRNIPYLVVYNKADLLDAPLACQPNEIAVSAKTGQNIYELKERIGRLAGAQENTKHLVADLIDPGDVVVLVTPIDSAAPKGRLILPQQQVIRDILDAGGINVVVKESELTAALAALGKRPKLVITDLLPHLGREQGKKPLNEAIPSESLNILIGSWPEPDDDGPDRVKLAIMRILHEKYGIVEEDFISAELEAVPAASARDLGFDRSLIGAYGHDDRVCAYAELAAILQLDMPEKTAVCIFADKEEIGSEGVSGMQSEAFEHFMKTLCGMQSVELTDCFANSFCISADVTAAYDPNFSEVYERRNAAYVNYGVGLCKYTGSGGKGGASDASAEVVGRIRKLFNGNGVMWQMAELGKTDAGGGGTVAKYMAKRNIDTLDAGVPVLSMHAPYETVAKLDCYMTYKGMKVFFEQN